MIKHAQPFRLKELKIEVTHDCRLKCVHCSSVATESSSRTLSWNDCSRIITEAQEMGVRKIAFSGGEPLLWNGLLDAVSLAKNYGIQVFLYTTGNVPNIAYQLEQLQALGLDKIMFSIFSTDALEHEKVTAVEGSFNISIMAVQKAVALDLDVEFHFVPLSHNYLEINDVAEMAKQYGVGRVSVLRLVPQGRAALDKQNLLSNEQNLGLRRAIKKLRNIGHDIRTGSPYNFLMLKDKPACCSGIDRLTIGPDLKIYPCDAFKHIPPAMINSDSAFDSLKGNSLHDCWNKSPYLNKVREYLTTPFANDCEKCDSLKKCLSGCVAQKIHYKNELIKCPDPMCLKNCYI